MSSIQQTRHLDHRHAAQVLADDNWGFYGRPFIAPPARVTEHAYTAGVLILTVSGDLDATTSPLLQEKLNQDLPTSTVVDLSRVTFLGVAGLRVLETAAARARPEHRRIALVTASPAVLRILRLFALDVRVPVHPRLSAAIREYSAQDPGSFS